MRSELERVQADARALEDELRAAADGPSAPVVHPELVKRHVAELRSLIAEDLSRAKTKIARHLEGHLKLTPEPAEAGERRAKLTGRVTAAGLLAPPAEPEGRVVGRVDCGGAIQTTTLPSFPFVIRGSQRVGE